MSDLDFGRMARAAVTGDMEWSRRWLAEHGGVSPHDLSAMSDTAVKYVVTGVLIGAALAEKAR